jgi:hypothetical protein
MAEPARREKRVGRRVAILADAWLQPAPAGGGAHLIFFGQAPPFPVRGNQASCKPAHSMCCWRRTWDKHVQNLDI